MCGIVAVLRRRARRAPPAAAPLQKAVGDALALVPESAPAWPRLRAALEETATLLEDVDAQLQGPAGVQCLLAHPDLAQRLGGDLAQLQSRVERIEAALDAGAAALPTAELEALNAALLRVKDATWAVQRDRLRTARAVADLAGRTPTPSAIEAFTSIQVALSALDRLEVRGRDSAGLHVLVTGHGLDLRAPDVAEHLGPRLGDRLFTSRAARAPAGLLAFVYKHAAEIGELGDNVRALRAAITADELLHRALRSPDAEAVVLAHTRWASVGIISQPNAHPLNEEETSPRSPVPPYVVAVLNGDVDNHVELAAAERLAIAAEITTDAKIIPVLVGRRLAEGRPLADAFRRTVATFTGSVAIAVHSASAPGQLLLALRGSGQALYVGLAEDAFVVASEPYGLVETTRRYLRMDGETPGNPANPAGSQGQVLVLDRGQAGTVAGIARLAYDGTPLPVAEQQLACAPMTTRDIDRGPFPRFLLKEITESPRSLQKTLRGRITSEGGRLAARVGPETLPARVAQALRDGTVRKVLVIGQGTAAVAGQGVAAMLELAFDPRSGGPALPVVALPATELSGFQLREDMRDVLVLAISQSGTTTDTNRTVDLVRARGASVLSIVNRRGSDLCDKSDGVLFTSDGRDVEMSVASTKAFYAQIAAGTVLAFALARARGHAHPDEHELLAALRDLPERMQAVLAQSEAIGKVARAHAPQRRYWAVVGNGSNRIAAQEVRIKLSELCYKSIACDATEDKKHIDLSSEPLILVCAAGLSGSTADDVAKEIAIYRAHKAAPIVIASEGDARFPAALEVLRVPAAHPALAFVLAAVAGHLFGYHAALAIDALARPLRALRGAIEDAVGEAAQTNGTDAERLLARLRPKLAAPAAEFFALLEGRACDGQLEARTAVRIASLLRYASGVTPLESFAIEHGRPGTPAVVIDALTEALTRGIEELTRPIDAIKHQAKTVTVGISRSDEALVLAPLVKAALAAGAPRDRIQYRDLRALAALSPAVAEVTGWTRYRVTGDDVEKATLSVVGSGGIARNLPSRVSQNPSLRGTKHMVANERQLFVARGRSDDRTVILVPEVAGQACTGITLLHVRFHERLAAEPMRAALAGYRNRFAALKDAVTETDPVFREDVLAHVPVVELLTTPVHHLADRWKRDPA